MASNYWTSSQFKQWVPLAKLYRKQLAISNNSSNSRDESTTTTTATSSNNNTQQSSSSSSSHNKKRFSETEKQMLIFYYIEMVHKWGEKLQLQQRVISTAIVYIRRFYIKNELTDCDPYLLSPTALLLATKMEECPHNYKTSIVKVLPSDYPYGMHMVIECEAYLMEHLDFHLHVFHPYKPLELFIRQLEQCFVSGVTTTSAGSTPTSTPTLTPTTTTTTTTPTPTNAAVAASCLEMTANYQMCINFINDSYYSPTICLQYAPHHIALAAIYMCGILFDQTTTGDTDWMRKWFYDLNVDMSEISDIVNDMLEMYKMIHALKTGDEIGMMLLKLEGVRREERRKEANQKMMHRMQHPMQPQPPMQQQHPHAPHPSQLQHLQQQQQGPPQSMMIPHHMMDPTTAAAAMQAGLSMVPPPGTVPSSSSIPPSQQQQQPPIMPPGTGMVFPGAGPAMLHHPHAMAPHPHHPSQQPHHYPYPHHLAQQQQASMYQQQQQPPPSSHHQ